MTKTDSLRKALLISALPALSFISVAQAGFEWKGTLEPPGQILPPPTQSLGASNLAPIGWQDTATVPQVTVEKVESVPVETLSPAAKIKSAPVSAPVSDVDALPGFGTDLPLALALTQVAPPGYRFSFGDGVNAGTHVSWKGGKRWEAVLAAMLQEHGLAYTLQDSIIVINKTSGDVATTAMTPVSAPKAAPFTMPLSLTKEAAVTVTVAPLPLTEIDVAPMSVVAAAPMDLGAPASAPPSSLVVGAGWRAAKGQTLKEVLTAWSETAGAALYWTIDYDYKIQADQSYSGSYHQVVSQLLDQFSTLTPRPYGQLHQAENQNVLIIKMYDIAP